MAAFNLTLVELFVGDGILALMRTDLAAFKNDIQVELRVMKRDLLRWMVGVAFAQVGLTVALIRFLPQ